MGVRSRNFTAVPRRLSRRSLLAMPGRLVGAIVAAPLLAAAGRAMGQGGAEGVTRIVRSARPQDLETPVALLDSWLTPNDRFFVRSHLYTPDVDVKTWRLTVDGEVDTPLILTLDELRRFPEESRVVTLECAGNGRAYYDPPVAGVQWRKGAVGTARWTGVRLADVLARARVKPAARFVLLDGADAPIAAIPDFVRQLPLEKALHPDTLLAYGMNGTPLPMANGFPLRAIVPGWEGAYAVKWLTGIRVRDREGDSFWIKTAYRYPKRRIAPGTAVGPEDMAPVAGLFVKSLIAAPLDGGSVMGSVVPVKGFAWAGEANITLVDVSVDGGSTWSPARLGTDRAPYAWRQFEYEWHASEPGSYVVMSRASDDRGRVQPIVAQWNPSGYLWNAVDQVRVEVVVGTSALAHGSAQTAPRDQWAPGPEPEIVSRACLTCHERDLIAQQRLTRAGWTREVEKMIRWGAPVSDAEKTALIDFLTGRYPVR
jgi:sulfite oxidase